MNEFPETEEDEEVEPFTLLEPPRRITLAELPISPRKHALLADSMGWDVVAWLAVGEVAPTFYVGNAEESATEKNQHVAGDVKALGYLSNRFAVEARDQSFETGFRSHYAGKLYDQNPKKNVGGAFKVAMVADAVGLPKVMHATYKLIKPSRDKYETEKSFARRLALVEDMIAEADRKYNDGMIYWDTRPVLTTAGEFESWLNEWKGFTNA